MNALELQWALDALQHEIDLAIQDQGNHAELSVALQSLTHDKIWALLAQIIELRSTGKPVTYDLLASAIGEEETI
jgi:hypothetical protein